MASILVGESKGSYKGLQAWHQGRGARSAQDLQFQEIETGINIGSHFQRH